MHTRTQIHEYISQSPFIAKHQTDQSSSVASDLLPRASDTENESAPPARPKARPKALATITRHQGTGTTHSTIADWCRTGTSANLTRTSLESSPGRNVTRWYQSSGGADPKHLLPLHHQPRPTQQEAIDNRYSDTGYIIQHTPTAHVILEWDGTGREGRDRTKQDRRGQGGTGQDRTLYRLFNNIATWC